MPNPENLAKIFQLDSKNAKGAEGSDPPFDENAMKDMEKLFEQMGKEMGQ